MCLPFSASARRRPAPRRTRTAPAATSDGPLKRSPPPRPVSSCHPATARHVPPAHAAISSTGSPITQVAAGAHPGAAPMTDQNIGGNSDSSGQRVGRIAALEHQPHLRHGEPPGCGPRPADQRGRAAQPPPSIAVKPIVRACSATAIRKPPAPQSTSTIRTRAAIAARARNTAPP